MAPDYRLTSNLFTASLAMLASGVLLGAQKPVFKGVELVGLTVTVVDGVGQYITGLDGEDFNILEDGIPQRVSLFADGRVPVDVAFVIDTSRSMEPDLPLIKRAVHGLLNELRRGDRAAVVELKDFVGMPQPLTAEHPRVVATVNGLGAGGATAMYDGVYIALKDLERAQERSNEIRRRVLILLSDGIDNTSHVTFETVMDLMHRLDVSVYTVRLREPGEGTIESLAAFATTQASYSMRAMATESGGRAFMPTSASELPPIYRAIADELAFQYVLGYVPTRPADGRFRRVAVRVLPPPSATARTRSGYVASHLVHERRGGRPSGLD